MEDRQVQGKHVNFVLRFIAQVGEKVVSLMPQGLADTEEEESHTETSRKEHGKILKVVEFWLGILRAEFNVTKLKGQEQEVKLLLQGRYEESKDCSE